MTGSERIMARAVTRAVLPEGLLIHGGSIVRNGMATLFLAPSGGGKTTLLKEIESGQGTAILEDDETVISTGTDGMIRCLPSYRSLFEGRKVHPVPALLKNAVFIEKGNPERLVRIGSKYAVYRALKVDSYPGYDKLSPGEREALLRYADDLFRRIDCYTFSWSPPADPLSLIDGIL